MYTFMQTKFATIGDAKILFYDSSVITVGFVLVE